MNRLEAEFAIVRLVPDSTRYYPASVKIPRILKRDNFIKHTEMDIALGKSRVGGPVVDLPNGAEYPLDLFFACQLDLAQASPFDTTGLLPKFGQLLFFTDLDKGKVIYSDSVNTDLVRTIKEHEESFWDGKLVANFHNESESLTERFDLSLYRRRG